MRLLFVLQRNIKDLLDSFEEINLLSSSNEVRRPKGPKATDAFIDFSPYGRRPKGCFSLRPANFVSASALAYSYLYLRFRYFRSL